MLITSYYTDLYAVHAECLVKSLDALALSHHVQRIETLGSWQSNTQFKANFLRDMRMATKGSLIWLDADAVVHRYPLAFDVLAGSADIAVHYRGGKELLSGTIWLADTDAVRDLLDRWVWRCGQAPKRWDQQCLDDVIGTMPNLRVHRLPPEYCCIFDSMRRDHPGIDPVIEHFQASRKLKHCQGVAS